MKVIRIACALALALLGGCASLSPEESRQAYTDRLVDTCDRYGFVRSTPPFAQCMMQLDQADAQWRQQRAIAIMNHFSRQRSLNTTCQAWPGGSIDCQTR
jgi:hypothetical protein